MQESDSNKVPAWFQSEMECLFAFYPAVTLSVATKIAWWSVLRGVGRQELHAAIGRACAKSTAFVPSAFAVLEEAKGEQKAEERAALMWPAVMKAAGGIGSGELDDIGKAAFEQMGGRKILGQVPEQEMHKWKRKEFEEIYAVLAKKLEIEGRPALEASSRKLIGEGSCP